MAFLPGPCRRFHVPRGQRKPLPEDGEQLAGLTTRAAVHGGQQGDLGLHPVPAERSGQRQVKVAAGGCLGERAIARERGQSLAQMALAWVLRDSAVSSALIGASRVEQIEQNVAALQNLQLSPEECTRIHTILA